MPSILAANAGEPIAHLMFDAYTVLASSADKSKFPPSSMDMLAGLGEEFLRKSIHALMEADRKAGGSSNGLKALQQRNETVY